MKALRQLGFLKISLRPETAAPEEDHRVLALFRNRAELKKAYGELQEEIYRLKDLVKQQEGATQRAQEMLSTLEARLGATDTAYPAAGVLPAAPPVAGRPRAHQAVRPGSGAPAGRARAARAPRPAQPPPVRAAPGGPAEADRSPGAERRVPARSSPASRPSAPSSRASGTTSSAAPCRHASRARRAPSVRPPSHWRPAQAAVDEVERSPVPEFPGLSLQARRSHQPRRHRLRRGAVPAPGGAEDAAGAAGARGDRAARGERELRHAARVRAAHGADRPRAQAAESQRRPGRSRCGRVASGCARWRATATRATAPR